MRCARCNHENLSDAKFCEQCAAPLLRRCPQCNGEMRPSAKFCPQCAHPTNSHSAVAARPESYTPKHLAEKILLSKSALEGERKQVTVLFADLKGSMELLADRDPEEARKILDPVLEHMMEAVHHYEGTVNQVMGDGIMALFGAPLAIEDHAVRACYAALRMQATVSHYGEERQRQGMPLVAIRVGINSGEVVVRAISNDLHMDYTAVGQTTHLAARLEQLAQPTTTLMTNATLRLVEGYVRVKSLGKVPIKGLGDPYELYELLGASTARTRMDIAAVSGFTKFVGRDAEMKSLYRALTRIEVGHGQVVSLIGEPGVGKSRLCHEFLHSHRATKCRKLEAPSVSYGKATSYLPIATLLRRYFHVEDRDDARATRSKVIGAVFDLDRALEPLLPALFSLMNIEVEDSAWQALDSVQRRQRIMDAIKTLLLRESRVQPLLLIFEDLHWIDSETEAVLDSLVDSLPAAPILLLTNYRPEYQPRWGAKSFYTQIRLNLLQAESAQTLLTSLLGSADSLAPAKETLITVTEGNPFFLEECVREMVESGAIEGVRGAYKLVRSLETFTIPRTVQAVLSARIDRLDLEDKHLLQLAAVIGKDVPFALLESVAGHAGAITRAQVARLQAAEFFYEVRQFPELAHTFKHALTHDVVYGSMLLDQRRTLHATVLRAMENAYARRLEEHVERLAHHAVQAELWSDAVTYLEQAARRAYERDAATASIRFYRQAIDAHRQLPQGRESQIKLYELQFEARRPAVIRGEIEIYQRTLLDAEATARALGDQGRLGYAVNAQGWYFIESGQPHRALEVLGEGLRVARELSDSALEAASCYFSGHAYNSLGQFRDAIRSSQRAIKLVERDPALDTAATAAAISVAARFVATSAMTMLGDFDDALDLSHDALCLAEARGRTLDMGNALQSFCTVYLERGDTALAMPLLQRTLQLEGIKSLHVIWRWAMGNLAWVHSLKGDFASAQTVARQTLADARNMSVRRNDLSYLTILAIGLHRSGQRARALSFIEKAVTACSDSAELLMRARSLLAFGNIQADGDDQEALAAEVSLREALQIAERVGARPMIAHGQLALGKWATKWHRPEEAKRHLDAAQGLYREMGMTLYLRQAEEALAG